MEEKVDRTKLEYQKDRRIAMLSAVTLAVVLFLLLHFNGYQIPTPPLPEQLLYKDAEMELIPLEVTVDPASFKDGGSKGGEGTPSNDPLVNRPNPQTERILSDNTSQTSVNSGQSTRTNTDQVTQNTPTTIKQSEDPFGSGGGGTKGLGSGVFGSDLGAGNGNGNGNGMGSGDGDGFTERKRLTNLNTSGIRSNQDCTIKMRLTINSEGNVVGVEVMPGTTTSDQNLIQQITSLVKQQIKYNKRPNTATERIPYSVNIKAT